LSRQFVHSWPGKGEIRDLRLGEYMRSSKKVWYRCAGCGGTSEIDGHDYGISGDGRVYPEYVCPDVICQRIARLKLENWFDTTDVIVRTEEDP